MGYRFARDKLKLCFSCTQNLDEESFVLVRPLKSITGSCMCPIWSTI